MLSLFITVNVCRKQFGPIQLLTSTVITFLFVLATDARFYCCTIKFLCCYRALCCIFNHFRCTFAQPQSSDMLSNQAPSSSVVSPESCPQSFTPQSFSSPMSTSSADASVPQSPSQPAVSVSVCIGWISLPCCKYPPLNLRSLI